MITRFSKDWDLYFIGLAEYISKRSKDNSTKVGAVIVNSSKIILATGYNGFPQKLKDNPIDLENRERKYARILHAEINSIIFSKQDLTDCIIYTYPFLSCTKAIIQSGITRIVTLKMDESSDRYQRWKDDFDISREMYNEAGIEVLEYNPAEIKTVVAEPIK